MLVEVLKSEREEILMLLSEYGFEGVQGLMKNTLGYTNEIFVFESQGGRYVLRKSNQAKCRKHLEFEVEVLSFFDDKEFSLIPKVYENLNGDKITSYQGRLYVLQSFMDGDSKACWNDLSKFSLEMLDSFFDSSAQFTREVRGFVADDCVKEPTLFEYVLNYEQYFQEFYNKLPNSVGRSIVDTNKDQIFEYLEKTRVGMLKVDYGNLQKQIVHFDLHPGNVNFVGDKVSGIFDFDWVRFDNRFADFVATIAQSCWDYGGEDTGVYNKQRVSLGLKAYRKQFGKSEFTLEQENMLLVLSMYAYLFYQLLWTMDWYKDNTSQGDELVVQTLVNSLVRNDFEDLFSHG